MSLNEKDMELIERGTKALIKELGYSGFLKYLSRVSLSKKEFFISKEIVCKDIAIDNEDKYVEK